jgi:hypothetical protein
VLTDPADPLDTLIRCESQVLSRASAERPEVVAKAVDLLLRRIKRWATHNGYLLAGHRTYTVENAATMSVILTVESYLRPRTDGEWPSIHLAIRQDKADREALSRAERARDAPRLPRSPDPF